MRILLIAIMLVASYFSGPGWYVVDDSLVGQSLVRGPLPDQKSCEAGKAADTQDEKYSCKYFNTQPAWDDT